MPHRRLLLIALASQQACALSTTALRDNDTADSAIAGLAGTRLEDLELRNIEVILFENTRRGFGQGRESFDLTLRGKRAWSVECESFWEHAVTPPARITCIFEPATATATATLAPIRLAMTADKNDKFTGYAIAGDRTYAIEGKTIWTLRSTSSTSSTTSDPIAEIEPTPELQVSLAPNLAPNERQTISALALALEVMRDPRTAFKNKITKSSKPAPQSLAARSSTTTADSSEWNALGRPDLAGAIATLQAQLNLERDPKRARPTPRDDWTHYDDPKKFAAVFGVGAQVLTPFDTSTTLGRTNAGALSLHLGADLGHRLELAIDVALGGRALDAADLSRRLNARGTVDTLANYANRNSSVGLSGAGALWIHLALRYALADWTLRPYAGILGGYRYEPLLFKSTDFKEACVPSTTRELFCGASQGYAIESPSSAFSFGPLFGVRHALTHSDRFGLELRIEAQGHATIWSKPKLRFDGDVTDESLSTFARWQTVDYGNLTFDLVVLAALDVRVRF